MIRAFIFILILLLTGLWSCQNNRPSESADKTATVTILPQKFILGKIAGDKFRINVLIPEEANHETYEPSARQMIETGNSRAYFKVGHLDVEKSWLGKLAESNPGMKIFDTSEGYDLMSGEAHEHGDHTHEGGIDPHTWLSVSGVRVQAANMLKGLSETDPLNSEYYKSNYALFIASLDSLDKEIRMILSSAGTESFMIYHPSLGYFARDYNLHQIAIEQEGKEPSPAYMKELIDLARLNNIRTIFISSQFNKQSAETIAGQLNAKVEEFNPSSPDWSNNLKSIAKKIASSANEQ